MALSFFKSNGKTQGVDPLEITRLSSDASSVAAGCKAILAGTEAQAQHLNAALTSATEITE